MLSRTMLATRLIARGLVLGPADYLPCTTGVTSRGCYVHFPPKAKEKIENTTRSPIWQATPYAIA